MKCCCSAERIAAIAIQCSFVMQRPRENNPQNFIVISNPFENFAIHETMLSAIFHLFVSFRSRKFPKPRICTVFSEEAKIIRQ